MRRTYEIFRAILVALLVLAVGVPALLYVLLSIPGIQNKIRTESEHELTSLLGTEVNIGKVSIAPFNRVTIEKVVAMDADGDTALRVGRLGAGIKLKDLLLKGDIVVTYIELIGLDARINRESPDSPLNIQPIIDALKPKDKTKPPTRFDLAVNSIVIRRSSVSYDVLSEPDSIQQKLNPAHASIYDLKADIRLPRIKNDDFSIDIKRLALKERSGFSLESLSGLFHISNTGSSVSDMTIDLPGSHIALADMALDYDSWQSLQQKWQQIPIEIGIIDGSYISLADFSAMVPAMKGFDDSLSLNLLAKGTLSNIDIDNLDIVDSSGSTRVSIKDGNISGLCKGKSDISILMPDIDIEGYGVDIADLVSHLSSVSQKAQKTISNLGHISVAGKAKGSLADASFLGTVKTASGRVNLDLNYRRKSSNSPIGLSGHVKTDTISLGTMLENQDFNKIAADITFDVAVNHKSLSGTVTGKVPVLDYKGHRYDDISADISSDGKHYAGNVILNDDNVQILIDGDAKVDRQNPSANLFAQVVNANLNELNLWDKYPDHSLSASLQMNWSGNSVDTGNGTISLSDIAFVDTDGAGINIDRIELEAINTDSLQYINLRSDIIEGAIVGQYDFATLASTAKDILSHTFPVFFGGEVQHSDAKTKNDTRINNFSYNFVVKENNELTDFFKTPIRIVYPITINGLVDEEEHHMALNLDAPYLQQKNKLIENTALRFNVDGSVNRCELYATTVFPTKKGPTSIVLESNGASDRIDTDISWIAEHPRTFKGNVNLSTLFGRNENDNGYTADVDINPSQIIINDTTWVVSPAKIYADIAAKHIDVDGIDIRRSGQYITLGGTVSDDPADELCLQLLNVNLDYVFETLDISAAMFGGDASGKFYAAGLFTKEPRLNTPGLHVDNITYNGALMGDADIVSSWNNTNKSVDINATISQTNGRKSLIDGSIYVMRDSLDFRFKADKANIGFMRPYMEAFTSEVSGYASGDAHLWGTFKLIDMSGRLFAEDLKVKIDYTNTYYSTTDSVIINPGSIEFTDVKLHDAYGNTANLSGSVTHSFFKLPHFKFDITDAKNFLCYDVTPEISPDWYGKIFGNGTAFVKGAPGLIEIDVNMSTAPQSVFTFVLSDTEAAGEYTFIEFRDRNYKPKPILPDTILERGTPELAELLQARIKKQVESNPSVFHINLQADVTPEAQMILVMDPIGGDRIKANGKGNLRLEYVSSDDEFKMFGSYILDRGSYNFTLQDIIIKNFTINPGSAITFTGDPLAATLNIEAVYSVNANLSDLDESFLQDRELNRTNVPVHALLKVNGDMRQPDIAFDLEFPTLTHDTYRKVKSIISTEEMMSRQILYLLALNRFYTPDYMGSTTKGNELVSVASSTISSQLSSMLGQLSDNWSIAPNFRSDNGDFSDVEVDLALSSHLLNNRLLFNGNFGYRDNVYNSNTFIGDFDIEYLLNKSGNIRLKAYNRYNDQNYYVRTALTTQGVGVVFKRDFDNIFSFIHRAKNKDAKNTDENAESDTTAIATDSIAIPDNIPADTTVVNRPTDDFITIK